MVVESLRKQHHLEDMPFGFTKPLTCDVLREFSFRSSITLVHYAEMECDIACWVIKPGEPRAAFCRMRKPIRRRSRAWEVEEPFRHAHDAMAAYDDLITPIKDMLPQNPDALVACIVSEKGMLQEMPFASLLSSTGVPFGKQHFVFTVHSVAVLSFAADVLNASLDNPAFLSVGLADFLPHFAVPHPEDPSKIMGLQHRSLLNEWGFDILIAGLRTRTSSLDDLDV